MIMGLVMASSLVGCGDDADNNNKQDMMKMERTGVFIDSAVSGLHYSTPSQNGTTNEKGEFTYLIGEQITFSIGDIHFPAVDADAIISPLDIFATEDVNNTSVTNMLRLLQSLDVDGIAENGIEISDLTHQLASGLSVDFADDYFDDMVQAMVASSGGVYQSLIPSQQASDHFSQTITAGCSSNHNKVGYSGQFQSFAHNVSGTATIVDDCSIEITNFSYDGGGPAVYFYGGFDHQYAAANAFPIGESISGQVYNGEKITLSLPAGKTLDDLSGLSVWCVDFNADFGNIEFISP